MDVIQLKNDHIEELQEALKESVTIISEREEDLFQEQIKRKDIQDQVLNVVNYHKQIQSSPFIIK